MQFCSPKRLEFEAERLSSQTTLARIHGTWWRCRAVLHRPVNTHRRDLDRYRRRVQLPDGVWKFVEILFRAIVHPRLLKDGFHFLVGIDGDAPIPERVQEFIVGLICIDLSTCIKHFWTSGSLVFIVSRLLILVPVVDGIRIEQRAVENANRLVCVLLDPDLCLKGQGNSVIRRSGDSNFV